jgi:hypothetical protein
MVPAFTVPPALVTVADNSTIWLLGLKLTVALDGVTVVLAEPTLKVVLFVEMLSGEFSGSVAVSVSPLVAPVKARVLNVATPLLVDAEAGDVVRSELASVAPMLMEPVVNVAPLSVSVTLGAGDMAVAGTVPIEGGSVVKLMA